MQMTNSLSSPQGTDASVVEVRGEVLPETHSLAMASPQQRTKLNMSHKC